MILMMTSGLTKHGETVKHDVASDILCTWIRQINDDFLVIEDD